MVHATTRMLLPHKKYKEQHVINMKEPEVSPDKVVHEPAAMYPAGLR